MITSRSLYFPQVRKVAVKQKDIEVIDPNVYHNFTDKQLEKVAEATAEDENLLTIAGNLDHVRLVYS